MYYSNCPLCGRFHDDGAYARVGSRTFFVCFDCADAMTKDELKAELAKVMQSGRKQKTA